MNTTHESPLLCGLRWLYACAGAALMCVSLVPSHTLAHFFAHPARAGQGGAPFPETTLWGAELVRVLAPLAGIALTALALWGRRPWRKPEPPAPAAVLSSVSRLDVQLLLVAMAVAVAVRAPLLAQSLWYDEIAAFMGYSVHGPGVALGNYYTQANHVLQSVLTAISAWLFGVNEVSLRLPSLLVGIAAVPGAWWLGRETGSLHVARGAAFAMALMPVAVLESTEARGYAFMAYYSTLATAALLWARRTGSSAAWAEYAVICALGGWSHLVTICVPASHGVWSLWNACCGRDPKTRQNARRALAALAVAALLTLALYAPVLGDMLAIGGEFKAADGNEPTLWSAQGAMMLMMIGGTWTTWASLAALPLVVAGLWAARTNRTLALALSLTVGGACIALLAPALNSWLYARFLTFLVPAVALAVGAGGAFLCAKRPRTGAALVLLAGAAWVTSVVLLPPRQPLREGVEYIAAHRQPHDQAIAVGLPDDVQQFYAIGNGFSIPGTGPYGAHLDQALDTAHPRWVLLLYPRAMQPRVHERLRAEHYRPVARFPGWIDHGDGEVTVYERDAQTR